MTLEEMNISDVETRIAALNGEVEGMTDVEAVNAAIEEKRALLERKAELEEIEQRAKMVSELQNHTAEETIVVEERGKFDMENMEVRNSLEYGKAFLKGDMAECRALLSANGGGSVAVPEALENEIKNAWEECKVLSLAKHTNFKGNVKVGFEYSADGATVHVEGAAAPDEENLVWGYVELKADSIKKWITVSDEAIDGTTLDTLGNIYAEVAQKIVEEAEDIAIGKITASPATSSATACGVPVYNGATLGVDTITMAVAELSGKAKNLVAVMNRRTEAAFKSAAKANKYAVDPFDGITVIHTDALKAFSAAGSGDTYAIVGDFGYGFQANCPNGDEVTLKVDDLSLAEKDLVKIVGRQYIGMGVVAPNAFVKITK